jgi:hypothetical protein
MIEIALLIAFFTSIVVGGLIADAMGRLPNAVELEAEDRERFAHFEREP